MLQWFGKLGLCVGPLAASPLLLFLIADGYLNFGGGEKDIILMLPWVVWAVTYAVVFAVCWARKLPTRRGLLFAAGGATGLIAVAWAGLLVWTVV